VKTNPAPEASVIDPYAIDADGDDDPRFSFALIVDVADKLAEHGYPELNTKGLVDLAQALDVFLYPSTFPRFDNWPASFRFGRS
jgi:hypothetical protein